MKTSRSLGKDRKNGVSPFFQISGNRGIFVAPAGCYPRWVSVIQRIRGG
ncbi:MAG: hypothetical protein ACE5KJ_01900 [Candidatus Zixiibacteriota bacterium]